MEVKLNAEILDYTEQVYFGLSLRQFLCALLAIVVAVLLYLALSPVLAVGTVSWVCVLGAAPFAVLGFVRYHGMTAEQFLWVWLRYQLLEPKKLPCVPTNFYYEWVKHLVEQPGRGEGEAPC